jgi:hypothetical protein
MGLLSDLLKPQNAIPIAGSIIDLLNRRGATRNATQQLTMGASRAQEMFQPYHETGLDGLRGLRSLADPATAMSALENSPGYQFRLSEGLKAVDTGAAGRGAFASGARDKARMRYAQGLASNEYQNAFSRQAQLAGMGFGAASRQAELEQEIANALANGDFQRAQQLSDLIDAGADVAGRVWGA